LGADAGGVIAEFAFLFFDLTFDVRDAVEPPAISGTVFEGRKSANYNIINKR
jgi:hypothetical protein